MAKSSKLAIFVMIIVVAISVNRPDNITAFAIYMYFVITRIGYNADFAMDSKFRVITKLQCM